jgi:hypothetical protein
VRNSFACAIGLRLGFDHMPLLIHLLLPSPRSIGCGNLHLCAVSPACLHGFNHLWLVYKSSSSPDLVVALVVMPGSRNL